MGGFEAGEGVALPAQRLDWPGGAEAPGAAGRASGDRGEVPAAAARRGRARGSGRRRRSSGIATPSAAGRDAESVGRSPPPSPGGHVNPQVQVWSLGVARPRGWGLDSEGGARRRGRGLEDRGPAAWASAEPGGPVPPAPAAREATS